MYKHPHLWYIAVICKSYFGVLYHHKTHLLTAILIKVETIKCTTTVSVFILKQPQYVCKEAVGFNIKYGL